MRKLSLAFAFLLLTPAAFAQSHYPDPSRPAFAVVGDLAAAFPQFAGKRAVAIEVIGTHLLITPPQHDRRFYALASVTNNDTQEMTIIAPR